MKALVWTAVRAMQIEERLIQPLKPGWIRLRVAEAGVCGSELSAYLGHNELRRPPLVMGHEFSGTVVETGDGNTSWHLGDEVTVNPLLTCGRCRHCLSGQQQRCVERYFIGVDFEGGFGEYVQVPATACYRVSNLVTGAFIEPLACAVRATGLACPHPADHAVVFGAGIIGLFTVRLLKDMGVGQCIIVDTNNQRLQWATMFGATTVLSSSDAFYDCQFAEALKDRADVVIDAVGADETRQQAINVVNRGGRVVWIGLHDPMTSLNGNAMVRDEITLRGSFAYNDEEFRRAVSLMEQGFVSPQEEWLSLEPIDEGPRVFHEQAVGQAKWPRVLLQFTPALTGK